MYATLLGADGFRKGMDLYFERHDGQAVTCDDFRAAMADANGRDLAQFERWYTQAGTPILSLRGEWDRGAGVYTLRASQRYAPGQPGGTGSAPLHLPLAVALLGRDGTELLPEVVLEMVDAEHTWTFDGITAPPVLSALRNFSAPVALELAQSDEELATLMAHDTDKFNAWQAAQQLLETELLALAAAAAAGRPLALRPFVAGALKATLLATGMDRSVQAYTLQLPSLGRLADLMKPLDPDALLAARRFARAAVARQLKAELASVYEAHAAATAGRRYATDGASVGARRMKNVCLSYLAALDEPEAAARCAAQARSADNMTDRAAATALLASIDGAARDAALASFHAAAAGDGQ